MKKHFLRMLIAFASFCLGAGMLAACDEEAEAELPDPERTLYTLTYDLDGGEGTAPAGGSYAAGETVIAAQDGGFFKTNCTFGGWLDGSQTIAAGAAFSMPARDVVLKAAWADAAPHEDEKPTAFEGIWTDAEVGETELAIRLLGENEGVLIETNASGVRAAALERTETGYRALLSPEEAELIPSEDGLIYRTVQDGSAVSRLFSFRAELPAPSPASDGILYGWENKTYRGAFELAENGTRFTADGTAYGVLYVGSYGILCADGGGYAGVLCRDGEGLLLYGSGRKISLGSVAPVTVGYSRGAHAANGATVPETETVYPGEEVVLPAGMAGAPGYAFAGWSVGGTLYAAEGNYTASESVTAVALWEAVRYTFAFDVNAPEDAAAEPVENMTATIESGERRLPVPELDAYILCGWKRNGEGETLSSFTVTEAAINSLGGGTVFHFSAEWDVKIATWGQKIPQSYSLERGRAVTLTATVKEKGTGGGAERFGILGQVFAGDEGYCLFRPAGPEFFSGEGIPREGVCDRSCPEWDETSDMPARYRAAEAGETTVRVVLNEVGVLTCTLSFRSADCAFTNTFTLQTTVETALVRFAADGCTAEHAKALVTDYDVPPVMYDVAFHPGEHAAADASVSHKSAAAGTFVTLPEAPAAAAGYRFEGWEAGGSRYGAESKFRVTEDVNFTAVWSAIEYTVVFEENKPLGSHAQVLGNLAPLSVTLHAPEMELPAPSLAGYTFAGWRLGDKTLRGSALFTEEFIPAEGSTVTLSAAWDAIVYTLRFNCAKPAEAKGEVRGEAPDMSVSLEAPEANLPALSLEGYGFMGWQKGGFGDPILTFLLTEAEIETLGGTEIFFTASWEKEEFRYTLRYFLQRSESGDYSGYEPFAVRETTLAYGATLRAEDYDVDAGSAYGVFLGWYCDLAGGTLEINGSFVPSDHGKEQFDVYAVWDGRPTVLFDRAGGTGDDPTAEAVQEGETYALILPACTYTAPAGMYFRGWRYGGAVRYPGEKIEGLAARAEVLLSAVWEPYAVAAEETVTVGHDWEGNTQCTVSEGAPIKLVAVLKDKSASAEHGIVNSGVLPLAALGDCNAHFRVNGYVFTTLLEGDDNYFGSSDSEPALKLTVPEETNFSASALKALYADADTEVCHVIEVSLENAILTYRYTVYADGEEGTPAVSTLFRATLREGTRSLTMQFLVDDGHMGDTANATMTVVRARLVKTAGTLSPRQNFTAEEPLSLSAESFSPNLFTARIYRGETLKLAGSVTLASEELSAGFTGGVSAGTVPPETFLMQNWLHSSGKPAPQTVQGLDYAYAEEGERDARAGIACSAEIVVDWSTESEISVSMKIGGFAAVWHITAENGLAESYVFALGLNCASAQLTALQRTGK